MYGLAMILAAALTASAQAAPDTSPSLSATQELFSTALHATVSGTEQALPWLKHQIAGMTAGQLLFSFFLILLGYTGKLLAGRLCKLLLRGTAKTKTDLDDILVASLEAPLGWVLLLVGLYGGIVVLPLPVQVGGFIADAYHSLVLIIGAWFAMRFVQSGGDYLTQVSKEREAAAVGDEGATIHQIAEFIPVGQKAVRTFIGVLTGVLVLQQLGYNVGAVLTGGAIGAAAIGLASKDTVANFFGSVVILVDRPFKVGDWIQVGDVEGTVEEIGLRVTRIRTFPNSQITMPNMQLTTTAINNWSRMRVRRVKTMVGLTYDTTPQQMRECVRRIDEMLRHHPDVWDEKILVYFYEFGASSLDIYLYYFSKTTVWAEHMAVRQDTLLKIFEIIEDMGLSVAFPTRTIHMIDESQELPEPGE